MKKMYFSGRYERWFLLQGRYLGLNENENNDGWWANTIGYTFFTHYGDFLDLLLMGRDADEVN